MKPYNKKKSENSNNPSDILIKTNFNKFKNCGKIENYVIKDDTSKDNPGDEVETLSFMDFKRKHMLNNFPVLVFYLFLKNE